MSHDTEESGQKRTIAVLVYLSPEELAALERLMVSKGFRMRATATRWAMLIVAGAHELAALSVPRIAKRRALDRSSLRVVRGDQ